MKENKDKFIQEYNNLKEKYENLLFRKKESFVSKKINKIMRIKTVTMFIIQNIVNVKYLDKNEIPYLFSKFYQANNSKGISGIGLYLIKFFVKLHRSSIEAEGQNNGGIKFKLIFPIQNKLILNKRVSNAS